MPGELFVHRDLFFLPSGGGVLQIRLASIRARGNNSGCDSSARGVWELSLRAGAHIMCVWERKALSHTQCTGVK